MFWKKESPWLGWHKEDKPDDESEESGDDEDIIKDGQCDEQPMESLAEFLPLHNEYSDCIAWKYDDVKDISNKVDDYQEHLEHQQK